MDCAFSPRKSATSSKIWNQAPAKSGCQATFFCGLSSKIVILKKKDSGDQACLVTARGARSKHVLSLLVAGGWVVLRLLVGHNMDVVCRRGAGSGDDFRLRLVDSHPRVDC
ncbi:unnamed protein product [Calypogeia fissa]